MKTIELTQGQFALVDDEDFEWLSQWKWFAKNYKGVYYAERNSSTVNGKRTIIRMHRLILGLAESKIFCDHIDRNTLNNQRSNLRAATNAQNCANRKSHKMTSSKYLGVSWINRDRKWKVAIAKNYKSKFIGYYHNEKAAALAYNNAAIIIHGEFANLNNVKEGADIHSD